MQSHTHTSHPINSPYRIHSSWQPGTGHELRTDMQTETDDSTYTPPSPKAREICNSIWALGAIEHDPGCGGTEVQRCLIAANRLQPPSTATPCRRFQPAPLRRALPWGMPYQRTSGLGWYEAKAGVESLGASGPWLALGPRCDSPLHIPP